jgi:(2R)-sulfolactate sulfo-lyase subunit alpha
MNERSHSRQAVGFLVHRAGDSVGVAIVDVRPGRVAGRVVHGGCFLHAEVLDSLALGHKFALRDVEPDAPVLKDGLVIGHACGAIARGTHVHTHNLTSALWRAP